MVLVSEYYRQWTEDTYCTGQRPLVLAVGAEAGPVLGLIDLPCFSQRSEQMRAHTFEIQVI